MVRVGQSSDKSFFYSFLLLAQKLKWNEIIDFDRSFFVANFTLYNFCANHFSRNLNGNMDEIYFSVFMTKKVRLFQIFQSKIPHFSQYNVFRKCNSAKKGIIVISPYNFLKFLWIFSIKKTVFSSFYGKYTEICH